MMRRSPARTALTIGGIALLAAGVIAGAMAFTPSRAPVAVDNTVTDVYLASSGEICYLQFSVVVNDPRESSFVVARRYLQTTDLQTLTWTAATVLGAGGVRATPSTTADEIASLLDLVRDGATKAVHASGSLNAKVFVTETHQCLLPPPEDYAAAGDPQAPADVLAGRQFSNWSVIPPDFEGFRVTASGEVCEVQVTVFFATSDPAVLARARGYLAGLDIATIDVSAELADQVAYPAASAYFSRAHLEGLLVGDSVSAILTNYLDAQGIQGVVNGGDPQVRCDND